MRYLRSSSGHTGNGSVLIRINNRRCGIRSVFQKTETEMGHSLKYSGGIWAESLFASLWRKPLNVNNRIPAVHSTHTQYAEKTFNTPAKSRTGLLSGILLEHDSTISLQDKAIITLAMYTGLHGCLTSLHLTLDSFDWEHDLIKSTQAKETDSPDIYHSVPW